MISQTPARPRATTLVPPESQTRPMTNAVSPKNKELEDLARLIQEATGSVNNIVESSQLMKTRGLRKKSMMQTA